MTGDGAVDTDIFAIFVKRVLVPTLYPQDIVLLDHLSVPQASCLERAVKAVGGHVILLPPYSPDFSPVDLCWSKLKTYLRSAAARTRPRLDTAVPQALQLLQPQDILGWFRHCGYLVSPK
jgi:transposase